MLPVTPPFRPAPQRFGPLLLLAALFLGFAAGLTAQVGRALHYYPDRLPSNFRADMTDDELVARLRELIPGLNDSALGPERQVENIRDWLHAYLPVADQHSNLGNKGVNHHRAPLGELLHLAESRAGGYYCGAATEIARQVFRLLGFDAHSINFGLQPDGATHLTTVVALPLDGREVWTIQDTYFDFTVRHRDGRYADFREILDLLVEGRTSELVIDEEPSARTPALYLSSQKIPRMSRKYDLDAVCVREFPEFTEFSLKWDFKLMLLLFGLRSDLERTVHTNYPLYLFAFPISTSGNQKVLDLKAYADKARSAILARVAKDPAAYAPTRIDAELAPDLKRIRNWPADG